MQQRKITDYLFVALRGMGMGAADVIPGVSGGTIAFITGIYEELISSIKSVNALFFRKLFGEGIPAAWKHINGNFLLAVFGGILISIFSLARLISWLLTHHPMLVWAFFFGLILASVLHVSREVKRWNYTTIISMLIGVVIAGYITIAAPASTPDAYWFIFVSGAIAICAMILPGISGAFILLLLGKYEFILNAAKDFNVIILLIFAMGCVVGLISFANLIAWLFRKYPNSTIALLTGFMIGSLNKLWPWKEVLEYRMNSHNELVPFLERSISPFTYEQIYQTSHMLAPIILCTLAGFALIMTFDWVAARQTRKKA